MVKRMLVDSNHPEENRVVIMDGTRLDGFDLELESRKQNKGNIYLAKVVRVEPSLQAAFVEYGGNRNGFLAFTEIHPDYFQIPVADKEALLAQAEANAIKEKGSVEINIDEQLENKLDNKDEEKSSKDELNINNQKASDKENINSDLADNQENDIENKVKENDLQSEVSQVFEEVGGEDESEEALIVHRQKLLSAKQYKIQEVIKKRQILLVQVSKEERGTKGAALSTYLSLAGRYCVLMPNNSKGGGVSRKITNLKDRKRLKTILTELKVSEQMAVILRTAGSERNKTEIKRDYDYLLRTWNQIRRRTMKSHAPELIHEEANLIKRSIRDVYSRDIEEILVEGDNGYKAAKEFMRILTPSHAKKVKRYKNETIPLFQKYKVESQIDEIHNPKALLPSGGSIVFGQTEALVAIDVNSGKSTKERHIEETALKTNIEASDEIARQLRLRDLAGLIVIDFIDMEEYSNNITVERKLKEALREDRARIQVGRISHFGLLELSRQRLRPSLIETHFESCKNCEGTGVIRSIESSSIQILRTIEEEALKSKTKELNVYTNPDTALYILNFKRNTLDEINKRLSMTTFIHADQYLIPPNIRVEKEEERKKSKIIEEEESKVHKLKNIDNKEELNENDLDKRKKRRKRRKKKTDLNNVKSNEITKDSNLEKKLETINSDELNNKIDNPDIKQQEADPLSVNTRPRKKRITRGITRWRRRRKPIQNEVQEQNSNKNLLPDVNNQNEKNNYNKPTDESKDIENKKNSSSLFSAIKKSAKVIRDTVSEKNDNQNESKNDQSKEKRSGWWNTKK